jgi:PAS domain S-box-containing protein
VDWGIAGMRDLDDSGRELTGEIKALHSRIAKLEQTSHNLPKSGSVDEELDRAWREWEATFDATKDVIFLTDNEFRIVQANLATSQLFDRPLDRIVGMNCWQLVHGATRPPKDCPLEKAKITKKHEEIELYLSGKGIWIADSVDPILDQQGGLTGAIHIIRDVTDRKQAERLLRKERDRAQKYLDVAGVMLVAIDAEQRVGLINKKGCEILGYNEDEIVAKNWFDNFLPKRIKEEVKGVFNKLLCGEADAPEYYENPVLTKNGAERLIAWHNTVLRDDKGKVIAALDSGEDITERKQAEQALKKSNQLLKDTGEMAKVGGWELDLSTKEVFCTEETCRIHGIEPGYKLSLEEALNFYAPESIPPLKATLKKIAETGEPYDIESLFIPRGSADKIWVRSLGRAVYSGGKMVKLAGTFQNIDKYKRAEEALRESEEKYRDLFENAREAIVILDLDGNITDVNKLIEEYGFKRDQLIGKSHFDFITEKYRDNSFKEFKKLTRGIPVEGEVEIITPKGNVIVEYRNNPIWRKGQIVGFQEVLIDITARKHAEEKVKADRAQLKSLASQLTLAEERERRRLAIELHDRISQSLVISKIKLEALRKCGYGEKLDKAIEEVCNSIGQTIQHTRTLTFDLGSPVLYELGFEMAVSEWLTSQIQGKHGLAVEFEDDGRPKPLEDDVRILLFRDVRELLINVVKHANAHKVKVSIRKLGKQICVTVEDDGAGFDPAETISMAAKRGEFGLFSIRERLEDLGGHLQIDSTPGRGCKVTMTAPLKRKEIADGRNRAAPQGNGN